MTNEAVTNCDRMNHDVKRTLYKTVCYPDDSKACFILCVCETCGFKWRECCTVKIIDLKTNGHS